MTAKHTPGPWKVFEHSWCETSITAPNTPNAICVLDINHATEESQESDEAQIAANACLIAAAPELLEALQELLSAEFDPAGSTLEIVNDNKAFKEFLAQCEMKAKAAEDKARAAIAKATGESA